jgi:phospholipid/cholesterol/gamma-HCH transport system permease protein
MKPRTESRTIDDTADYHVERVERGPGEVALRFTGELRFRRCFRSWTDVQELAQMPAARVDLDLAGLEHLDGAATALLLELRAELGRAGTASDILGARGSVLAMLELYGTHAPQPSMHQPPKPIGILDQIGREAMSFFGEAKGFDFVGDLGIAGLQALRRPWIINWREVPRMMERTGADGLPIVLMINFLVGLVTAFQAAIQLKQFGANIFVADLVGISITRELAPLMTAIIAAGRSGAAFSAELGTMRVSEEIDALRTLGLDPYHFLVFPRVLALAVVLPMLTILADLIGIAGGMLVAMLSLDLTANTYLIETQKAVGLWDVSSGCIKSVAFGVSVALIACQRGLSTQGGAEGVGRATTSAVVTSLFAIVVVDALFTVLFNAYGM